MISKLQKAVQKLSQYIEANDYKGYDRYDGLMSPVFKLQLLRNSKTRFVAQQLLRRSPVNLRPLLRIPKGYNPVTLGLCLQAYSNLSAISAENKHNFSSKIAHLIDELIALKSPDFTNSCWGYDFDWESRYSTISAFTPTVVATGIVTNGLFNYYRYNKDQRIEELLTDASSFIINDLNRIPQKPGFCFSYSPYDKQVVFNATMKGARLLAQAYSINKNKTLKKLAKETIEFVINHQREDGSWGYAHNDNRAWVDNYHTAYILDSLSDYMQNTGDNSYSKNLEIGLGFYLQNFFVDKKIAKTYSNKVFPIDSTSVAQSILTLSNFNQLELALNIANWVIDSFQGKDGHIYYRKYRFFKQKISYMRWSNAWMFVAFSTLLLKLKNK